MIARVPPPASVDLDQADRFLAKAVPWPKNGEGYVNIHGHKQSRERKIRSGQGVHAGRSRHWPLSPGWEDKNDLPS